MGPSFPRLRPAATANIIPIDLINKVHLPKNPRMMKPLRMVLILNEKGGRMLMKPKSYFSTSARYLRDSSSRSIRGKHADQDSRKTGKR